MFTPKIHINTRTLSKKICTSPKMSANLPISNSVQCVVGDWSGTWVDKYCMVPVIGMEYAFRRNGIVLTNNEIRKHMGLPKRNHIRKILCEKGYQGCINLEEKIYSDFNNELDTDEMLPFFNTTPYTRFVLKYLRTNGIKIGVTTGFTTETSQKIVEHIRASEGVQIDTHVGSDSVVHGSRPLPFMIWKCMDNLNISNPRNVVKIGDSDLDMWEGEAAGCWNVGVYGYSTHIGVSNHNLPYLAHYAKRMEAKKILESAGADYVIENMSMLPEVINDINRKIKMMDNDTPNESLKMLVNVNEDFTSSSD